MGADFKVVAIIAARNEDDIIGQVIEDLIRQRIQVYLIDDGSTDQTVRQAERWLGRGLLHLEQRGPRPVFEWSEILRRKQELAATLDAHWFVHHDADEFREAPWTGMDLWEAIREVDRLGYNAIDFRVLNFRPTSDAIVPGEDVRTALRYYDPAPHWDSLQIKAWKRGASAVDLVSSGGHEAAFADRRVCPVQFLVRHYPIRGQAHGKRKVFEDRRPRFSPAELEKGWHVQYDAWTPGTSFVCDPSTLREFDPEAVRLELQIAHRDTYRRLAAEAAAEDVRRRLTEAQARAAADKAALAQLQHAVAALERMNAAQQDDLARLQHAQAVERHEAAAQLKAIDLEVTSERSTAALRRQGDEQEIHNLRRELQSVYSSRSWRVTSPLRSAYDLLRPGGRIKAASRKDLRATPAIDWGAFARLSPISHQWGLDRGTPVDRHYIEQFLHNHRADIKGHVLEVKDGWYTTKFGGSQVTRSSILDVDASNAHANVVADLAGAEALPGPPVDCFILTQTLHIIYDITTAIRRAVDALGPGGVLLCTIPAVSRVNDENGGLESGDYWRLTHAAVRRLFADLPVRHLQIATFGNVRSCTAFLYGLAAEEVEPEVLDFHDPWFPLLHTVRAVKHL